MTAVSLARQIRSGGTHRGAACEASLDRIKRLEPSLYAFNTVIAEHALERARALDAAGPRRPRSRCASRRAHRASKTTSAPRGMPTTAVVEDPRAVSCRRTTRPSSSGSKQAGAVIVGKTNLRRVRDGIVDRELRVRPDAKSVGR